MTAPARRSAAALAAVALGLLLLGGCQNACQKICSRMASYARDCGYEVTPAEVEACREAQAGEASRDDRAVCREANDADRIREEWTCEDLEAYWSDVEGGGTSDTGR